MKNYRSTIASVPALVFAIAGLSSQPAWGGDSHSGYYYPEPKTKEIYVSPLETLPTATKRTRVGFTVGLSKQQLARSYSPGYHVFAKGADGQKLIIVTVDDGRYNTLYRLRAMLAALTAEARDSPLFSQAKNPEDLTFFDLAHLVGFTQITVTDGKELAHRINLDGEN